jgi:hypothetical protein
VWVRRGGSGGSGWRAQCSYTPPCPLIQKLIDSSSSSSSSLLFTHLRLLSVTSVDRPLKARTQALSTLLHLLRDAPLRRLRVNWIIATHQLSMFAAPLKHLEWAGGIDSSSDEAMFFLPKTVPRTNRPQYDSDEIITTTITDRASMLVWLMSGTNKSVYIERTALTAASLYQSGVISSINFFSSVISSEKEAEAILKKER